MSKKGTLLLSDGTRYEGILFGAETTAVGEPVTFTPANGYPEALSDPTNAGTILVATFPIQGNYGMPPEERDLESGLMKYYESEALRPAAFVVHSYTEHYSHWNAVESLGDALRRHGIVGLADIDTRELAIHLREHGPLTAKILVEGLPEPEWHDIDRDRLYEIVSVKEPVSYGSAEAPHVVVIDCGVKEGLLRRLLRLGVRITRVPWDYDFTTIDCDGLILSGGPGNPQLYPELQRRIRTTLERGKQPLMAVGSGALLVTLAIGGEIRRLQYGRCGNQSVRRCGTDRCFIAPLNTGYAIVDGSLPAGWEPFFVSTDDGGIVGIVSEERHCRAVAFAPEGCPGAEDTAFLFDEFVSEIKK